MTDSFYVEFVNDTDVFTLKFNVINNDIGNKWLNALNDSLNAYENPIRENDRLYNFPDHDWSESKIICILNECIDKINNYRPFIDMRAVVGGNHAHHNQLHKYFELMRGHIENPNDYFSTAPYDIKMIINLYNNTIHRLENHIRTTNKLLPRIVITFKSDPRFPLADNDFDQFTVTAEFGTVYLDYCEVGKTLLNVFHDNDHIVGDKSIIPQRFYSSGMCIKFYDGSNIHMLAKFNTWWNENEQYLNDLGFFKGDKTLSIGYLPIAKLEYDMSKMDIINNIGKFSTINRVYITNK